MKAKPLDLSAAALTGALCVVWGFNQVVAKLALPDVGPIMQTGVRSAIGAICVVAFALATNRRLFDLDGTEAAGALAGVLFTGEFIALYELLRFTTAARATVFVYAAPFFVAFGAAFLLKDERLRPIQWAGLGLAFLGVACGMAGRTPGGALAGDALALIAAALWGATTLVIKATPLKRADPLKVLLYQIGAAALIAPAAAYAFGEPAPVHLSGAAIASLVWQGVAVVGVSYALWFWVLTRYVVAQLSAFTFISRSLACSPAGSYSARRSPPPSLWRSRWCSPGLRSSTGRAGAQANLEGLLARERRVEQRQRAVDRGLVRRGARNFRRADGDGGVARWRAFGEEIVMADARQHGQFGAGNERRGDFAVGRGRGDLVGVAQKDRDRKPHALEAFRIEALDDARGHHERRFHSGMLRSSLAWASSEAPAGSAKNASASAREN